MVRITNMAQLLPVHDLILELYVEHSVETFFSLFTIVFSVYYRTPAAEGSRTGDRLLVVGIRKLGLSSLSDSLDCTKGIYSSRIMDVNFVIVILCSLLGLSQVLLDVFHCITALHCKCDNQSFPC